MIFNDRAKKIFLHGLGVGMDKDTNPFFQERGTTYLRFDSIRLENATDVFGGINAVYRWRGHDVVTIRAEGARMEDLNVLTLSGIEGRMMVELAEKIG